MKTETLDMLGNTVRIGDTLAVAYREGNRANLRVGIVVEFSDRNFCGKTLETVICEWSSVLGNGGWWSPPTKPTPFDEMSKDFVKIS